MDTVTHRRRNGMSAEESLGGDIASDMSFLEVLDVVNERLTTDGQRSIAFDSDCREGICGPCGMMIDGVNTGGAPDGNDILIGKTAVDDAMDAAACIGCAHLSRARH